MFSRSTLRQAPGLFRYSPFLSATATPTPTPAAAEANPSPAPPAGVLKDTILRGMEEPWLWKACAIGKRIVPLKHPYRPKSPTLPSFLQQNSYARDIATPAAERRMITKLVTDRTPVKMAEDTMYRLHHPLSDAVFLKENTKKPFHFHLTSALVLDAEKLHAAKSATNKGELQYFALDDLVDFVGVLEEVFHCNITGAERATKISSVDFVFLTNVEKPVIKFLGLEELDIKKKRSKTNPGLNYKFAKQKAIPATEAEAHEEVVDAAVDPTDEAAAPEPSAASPIETELTESQLRAAQLWYERASQFTIDWANMPF
ncbi:hypothetical protein ADEAN_000085400 [Angomonas deanei]|uniref:Uncharacterized protein n=1 Tax=Angomonas deanei TaxID=59799 RepID=A0A7G2C3W8_9TRYP|nr:hypothetical protein ADEAN_000085400 [Angomonas deanei]